jgi:hypothetical protein
MPYGSTSWGGMAWGSVAPPPRTPRLLVSTRPIRTNVVRATFDAAIDTTDRRAIGSATNPTNWAIAPRIGVAPAPVLARIDAVDGDLASVDLWFASPLVSGVLYAFDASPAILEAP